MSGLPQEWTKTTVGELADSIQYGHTASSTSEKVGPRFLRITDIQENSVDWETVPFCQIPQSQIPKYRLAKGDLVFARTGATVGKSFLIQTEIPESIFASYLIRVRVTKAIEARYLYYFFQSSDYWHQISDSSSGIGQPNVNGKKLAAITLPIAPIAEQRRIVARIEELFSRLDAGVAALRHAKAQLQRYRQSVLAAAVTGQLTHAWREQNPDTEPAEELLKRILELRPSEWTGRGKYTSPEPPDTQGLPGLPETWTWTNFETLAKPKKHALKAGPFGSALKKEFYVPSGYKIYGQEQVINDDPYFGDYYIDEKRFQSLQSCETVPGDFLISLVGTIGRTMIVPVDAEPGIINPRLVKMSLDPRLVDPRLLKIYLGSSQVKAFFKIVSHGGTMDVLNLTTLKALPIPLPPLAEQPRILDKVEARTIAIDHLEAELNRQITRSNRLRQSTLASAFAGHL